MVTSLDGLEAFIRVIGLPYVRRGDTLLAEYEDPRAGRIGIVVTLEQEGYVRVAVPTDVEPTEEGLRWLLSENFLNAGYKYALDYDGFIVVLYEAPAGCVENAGRLREAIAAVVEGYRRLMERVEKPAGEEEAGEEES